MPTADKLRWIDALHAAGVREIEVGSFVPARLLPQMADAAEVVRHARHAARPDRDGAGAQPHAAPRPRWRRACTSSRMPVSASAAHSLANVRKTREEMVEEVRAIADAAPRASRRSVKLEAGISTAFGCTLQGEVPEDEVIRLAGAVRRGRRRRIGPVRHRRLCQPGAGAAACSRRLRAELGDKAGAAHLHNTRGLGPGQLPRGLRGGRAHLRRLARRPRRLPLRARRVRQRGHRRPGLHVRGDGRRAPASTSTS